MRITAKTVKRLMLALLAAMLWLAVWQCVALCIGKELLLPSPVQTAQKLFELAKTGEFWLAAGTSLLRISIGFVFGILLGSALGVITALSRLADTLLYPIWSVIKAIPVTSFILLVLLWLTSSVTPTFISFMMTVPIAWASMREGVKSADKQLLEMTRVFKLKRVVTLKYVFLPAAMPALVSACTTGLGIAWKSGIAAEVIAHPALSIGGSMYESKLYIETSELFAWTAMVVILSLILEKVIIALLNRLKWGEKHD